MIQLLYHLQLLRINTEQDFPKSENSISSRRKEEGHRIQDWGGVGASVMEELHWIPKYVLRDGRMLCPRNYQNCFKDTHYLLLGASHFTNNNPVAVMYPKGENALHSKERKKERKKKKRQRVKGKWRDHNIRPFSITSLLTHTYSRGTTLSVMLRRRTHWLQASLQDIEGHLPILSMPFLLLLHPCCAPLKEVR